MAKIIDIKDLRALREARNMTQPELARAAGLSNGAISLIENGKRDPKYTTVVKLSKALAKNKAA